MDPLTQAALELAEQGFHIFPLQGKVPCKGSAGCHDAVIEEADVRRIFDEFYEADSIGIATDASGLIVLDLDRKNGVNGLESLKEILREDNIIPVTRVAHTHNRGVHVYFKGQANCSAGKLGPGIDIRGKGGYVVAPPSPGYIWHIEKEVAQAPNWLQTLLKITAAPKFHAPKPRRSAHKGGVPKGQRNSSLMRWAGGMLRDGLTPEQMLQKLAHLNETKCDPPVSPRELEAIVKSAMRYAR